MKPIATALALALTAAPALAEEAVLSAPAQAGSLHTGTLDMVAYYMPVEAGYELTATFATRNGGDPMRVVMLLQDGDDVAFTMPGHASTLYSFGRDGDLVTLGATPAYVMQVSAAE